MDMINQSDMNSIHMLRFFFIKLWIFLSHPMICSTCAVKHLIFRCFVGNTRVLVRINWFFTKGLVYWFFFWCTSYALYRQRAMHVVWGIAIYNFKATNPQHLWLFSFYLFMRWRLCTLKIYLIIYVQGSQVVACT